MSSRGGRSRGGTTTAATSAVGTRNKPGPPPSPTTTTPPKRGGTTTTAKATTTATASSTTTGGARGRGGSSGPAPPVVLVLGSTAKKTRKPTSTTTTKAHTTSPTPAKNKAPPARKPASTPDSDDAEEGKDGDGEGEGGVSLEAVEEVVAASVIASVPGANEYVVSYMGEVLHEAPLASLATSADVVRLVGEWLESELSRDEITQLCDKLFLELQKCGMIPGYVPPIPKKSDSSDDEGSENDTDSDGDDDDDDDEDEEEGEILGEGECELCEREMPLTKHHVIPRQVHERYVKKGWKKKVLNQGIMICRPCHNAVHNFWDNKTLAQSYNTVETLLDTEQMQKWIPYIRKQKLRTKRDCNLNYRH
ncbi:hypothetical protein Pelo_6106 [Pelomyxa schiedti]|nr:hypothetical protein Pelo_6106 [Pelomyxa schiedti]